MPFRIENNVLVKYKEEPGVTEVVVPEGVKRFSEGAFSGCGNITTVRIPRSVSVIDQGAFKKCRSLRELTLPDTVRTIEKQAFQQCTGLVSIRLPAHAYLSGGSIFSGCENLREIVFPAFTDSVEQSMFENCKSLTSAPIPESVRRIEQHAFRGCESLTAVHIPEPTQRIDGNVFSGCTALEQIGVSPRNMHFCTADGALYTKSMLELICCPGGKRQITIPAGVTRIGNGAFRKCRHLTEIVLPESVKDIREAAFSGCTNLREIVLPKSAQLFSAGNWRNRMLHKEDPADVRFAGCDALEVIRLRPDDPALYRAYTAVPNLDDNLNSALNMLRTREYEKVISPTVKYPLLLLEYLHTQDTRLGAYLSAHLGEIVRACEDAGDFRRIMAHVQAEDYFTPENIDGYIALVQLLQQTELFMALVNYKNAHFGFGDPKQMRL